MPQLGDARPGDVAREPSTAPELLLPKQDGGGVHSFASDFWGLGCLLYELASGSQPFGGASPTVGEQAVPPQLLLPLQAVPRISSQLDHLLRLLLQKRAGRRPVWGALRAHAFWQVEIDTEPLPPQPAYEAWLRTQQAAAAACEAVSPSSSPSGAAVAAGDEEAVHTPHCSRTSGPASGASAEAGGPVGS